MIDAEVREDDRLRPLWDFLDLDATEVRLRAALDGEDTDSGSAEVMTQLARLESLRANFAEAHRLLDEAEELAGGSRIVELRLLLERGRVLRLAGDAASALPFFKSAYETAVSAGSHFIAADAAHMCALVEDPVRWTERGLVLADRYEAASHWRGTLLLNLGRWQMEQGEYEEALPALEAALAARERDSQHPQIRELARYNLALCLRGLGRDDEALPLLRLVNEWAADANFTHPEAAAFRAELAAVTEAIRSD